MPENSRGKRFADRIGMQVFVNIGEDYLEKGALLWGISGLNVRRSCPKRRQGNYESRPQHPHHVDPYRCVLIERRPRPLFLRRRKEGFPRTLVPSENSIPNILRRFGKPEQFTVLGIDDPLLDEKVGVERLAPILFSD